VISVLLIIVGWLLKSDNGGTTTTAHLPTTPKAFSTNHSPSKTRVAAGAFGFLTLIQLFRKGLERHATSSLFKTMTSRPSLRRAYRG
jgi:hypothetical protein